MACGRTRAKAELLRVVLRDGTLVPDPGARLSGRGAYLCRQRDCLVEAVRRQAFSRSFRRPVRVPDDHLDWIR